MYLYNDTSNFCHAHDIDGVSFPIVKRIPNIAYVNLWNLGTRIP